MQALKRSFSSHYCVSSLGGDRLHTMYQPANAAAMMAAVKFEKPNAEDYSAVLDLAAAEIGGPLASLDEIRRVDAYTDASMWVIRRRGQVTGFLAPLALTGAGRDAMCDGSFDAANVAEEWIAPIGTPLAGFYCWSYAGKDQFTRGLLVLALRSLIDVHFADLPFFGKGTTEAGARIMHHLGFAPYDEQPGLYWRCRSMMDPAMKDTTVGEMA
jgi:hypothetical protein